MPPHAQPVALVTGSARGIGRAIALQLAKDGYAVVVNSTGTAVEGGQRSPAQTAVDEITRGGGTAVHVAANISKAEDRAALLEQVEAQFGRLDLLVNNAGIAPEKRLAMLESTEESLEKLLAVNLKGGHFLTQIAARYMIGLQKAGVVKTPRICFITSVSAFTVSINRADYCISKAAQSMSAALWAAELAGHKIPVVEIRPGIIATDMTAPVKAKYDALIAQGLLPQARWGNPEDVALAVSAFGRGLLDYSAGTAIDVSGGFQLKRL